MNSNRVEIEAFALQYRLKTRLSEDGTQIIPGKAGHIYEYDDQMLGVMVMPVPPRKRYWGCIAAALLDAGMMIVQDGNGEGALVFDPNNTRQSRAAIRAAGIKPKRQLSPEQRQQRLAYLRIRSGEAHSGPGTRRKPRKVGKSRPRRSKVPSAVSLLFEPSDAR